MFGIYLIVKIFLGVLVCTGGVVLYEITSDVKMTVVILSIFTLIFTMAINMFEKGITGFQLSLILITTISYIAYVVIKNLKNEDEEKGSFI